jgi:hypothetical protein
LVSSIKKLAQSVRKNPRDVAKLFKVANIWDRFSYSI